MLFHYHFWTPFVEETERFYVQNGFKVKLRTGKQEGEFRTFNPPLVWDDFRDRKVLFRIIEVRKGAVNITFGFGKKPMFDHIGYLVEKESHDEICKRASELGWEVSIGERRTFITTPYDFRIELQTNEDAIDDLSEGTKLAGLNMIMKKDGLEKDLSYLFGKSVENIYVKRGDNVTIKEANIKGISAGAVDPNGVEFISHGEN